MEVTSATFADLREKWPRRDPKELCQQFKRLKLPPASAHPRTEFKYVSPTGIVDREGRWLRWQELAKVGIFVQELYIGTEFVAYGNAVAGPGTKGQAVVKTSRLGTILWMRTGRVYSPNPCPELEGVLRVVFPPLRPDVDCGGFQTRRFAPLIPAGPEPLLFDCGPHQ